ncbi:hexokinase-2-like [Amphibalanus amphitrite]|uniref:hexokinase-2-like n=1 Tax=Amphibalanus amphitrite TaxID=1232801 RepID=UPI001C91C3E7|nr:hexokinase-2-like [Amphibalanus amphitrite]
MGLTDDLLRFDWTGVDAELQKKTEDAFAELRLTEEQIERVQRVFLEEMERGLDKQSESPSSLLMENTFLPELPNGHETGEYLALDLGGTNFRVMYLRIADGKVVEQDFQRFEVDEAHRYGSGEDLFDFLAGCVQSFLREKHPSGRHFELGFTFSFPMIQKSLDVGILQTWTKSFKASGCVGQDVVKMLNEALHRRGDINVDVVAIMNDTTGTLVQGASQDQHCAIGVILGTGSNAAYIERVDRVKKWDHHQNGIKEVVIDVEWGAFGDNGVLDFVRTDVDRAVDDLSLLVNSFTFEKYFSGKYLGEVFRQCMLKAHRDGVLFESVSEKLNTANSCTTKHVSMLEKDTIDGTGHHLEAVMEELQQAHSAADLVVLRYICALITVRAAVLVSACISVLLKRIDRDDCSIAVDGTLFKLHPRLASLMETAIAVLAPKHKFHLFLAEDGSGKGAALVAAVAKRLRNRK